MNVKQLKDILNQYHDDMELWVSDNDLGEGAKLLESVKKELAFKASLDGDLIENEYYYVKYTNELEIKKLLKEGYLFCGNNKILSKEILIINDEEIS